MKIQAKLSIFLVAVLVSMMTLSLGIGTWVINDIVYALNTAIFSLKLDEQSQRIESAPVFDSCK